MRHPVIAGIHMADEIEYGSITMIPKNGYPGTHLSLHEKQLMLPLARSRVDLLRGPVVKRPTLEDLHPDAYSFVQ